LLTADCFVDCHAHVLPDTVSAPTSRRSLDALAGLELPAEDAAAVRHGNAARLFGLSV